jgi:hypothetical protein
MANRQRDPAKEKFWRRTMARFRVSGLSIRDFCRREVVPEPNFYAWRAELARRDRSRPHRDPRSALRARSVKASFLPVRVVADPEALVGQGAVDIILSGGQVVRVRPGFDQQTLAQAIAVLENPGC